MRYTIFLFIMIFSNNTFATSCKFDGKLIPIGETVQVIDPVLIKDAVEFGKKNNKTESEIQKYIERADWLGYVLRCTQTYSVNQTPSKDKVADILIPNGVAMIPVDHQIDWISNLKKPNVK